jgi:TolB-like protein
VPSTRVAVARFDNETGDAGLDRFADALTDSVTEKLTVSATGRYGVIGNAAILRVPRSQRDLVAIGSSLHAGYVVLAQVRRDPTHCFVLAHLIRLPEQTHVAVTELDCSAIDSVQVPPTLANRIASQFSPLIAR